MNADITDSEMINVILNHLLLFTVVFLGFGLLLGELHLLDNLLHERLEVGGGDLQSLGLTISGINLCCSFKVFHLLFIFNR